MRKRGKEVRGKRTRRKVVGGLLREKGGGAERWRTAPSKMFRKRFEAVVGGLLG
mgnify:CR=1 FL=1